MWFAQFVVIFTLMSVGIASNFYVNTVSGCHTPLFHLHHGNALLNHVIKTLPLFLADCMTACQEMLGCFSINYYKNQSFTCDLNGSTKTQDPGSFVRMTGYGYAEPEKMVFCEKSQCFEKQALSHGWYRLGSSIFKYVSRNVNWQDAKQHCRTLGADLAGFENELENRFVHETMNITSKGNNGNTTTPSGAQGGSTLVTLKMDGTDPSNAISLFGGASVVDVDGKKAIYFDGVDAYATIPRFSITGDLTIAFWVKYLSGSACYIFDDFNNADKVFQFRIFVSKDILKPSFYNTDNAAFIIHSSSSTLPNNDWVHVAITWNRSTKEAKIFFNGNLDASKVSTQANVDFNVTPHPHYFVGAMWGGTMLFKGWMRELAVMGNALTQEDIAALKDNFSPAPAEDFGGTWVGLNDVTTEGTFQWSVGTPLTYSQHQSSDNTEDKDCVYLAEEGDSSSKWMIAECNQKKTFLCKKN